ncbi:DEAD/DEAH box helicase family protein [Bacillaceae bacterium SIJ1]|uniref:DEAD/DEAH box helicase n=1 Tax=Litoribacterium kuwaitense TaxID=1398745 RepID=UPI0013E9C431|nr:helicase-related protein [Litoribacterium kuwaitense]NGP44945.1 DEAD/DEAH box helicase family protein [Litoribacterium kuwaitense]
MFSSPCLDDVSNVQVNHPEKSFFAGRQLLSSELSQYSQIPSGYETITAVDQKNGKTTCRRCGNQQMSSFYSHTCAYCGKLSTYCRRCLQLGRSDTCTLLYRWPAHASHVKQKVQLVWSGELTAQQLYASELISDTIDGGEKLTVWAVCGSGKTEMLFAGIAKALSEGKRVAIASPRSDVIRELAPRLRAVFPQVPMAALYAGTLDVVKDQALLLCTTHQLLRFFAAFDCIIIDEVDAFPYAMDDMLQFAVKQAAKPRCAIIYLTATPSQEMKQQIKQKKLAVVRIPARYHGKPLPEPTFQRLLFGERHFQQQRIPLGLKKRLNRWLDERRPVFLFVPTVKDVAAMVELVQRITPKVAGVHAEDAERIEKVQAFRKQEIAVLVTTSILERGVTIPYVAVAVWQAHHAIFTESALVQICGRVGRSIDDPLGDIVLFHEGLTKDMLAARSHIQDMNHLAMNEKRGEGQ